MKGQKDPDSMLEEKSFLKELDDAVLRGSEESRAKALWYATDMLIVGHYSDEETWVFGEVIGRLAGAIEVATRAQLAKRLATASKAPLNALHKLAFDDAIEVAGPILQHCERLDSKTLVQNIRTKGLPHMLAISKRSTIPEVVTDELVTRGNRDVLVSVAANNGACISDFGFLQMVKRSTNDSILVEQLGLRKDIPRQTFQQLVAKASDDVRRKLAQERPDLAGYIHTSVAEVAGSLQSKFGPATKNYFTAKKTLTALHQRGELDESRILGYARERKLEETTVGLSLLCSLPANVVERALGDREMTLILSKACRFDWETTMALLFLGAKDHQINARVLEEMKQQYARLDAKTPSQVLSFYQTRMDASAALADGRRLPQLRNV
jgi:uncharacterized protein (DUF2336 family)